MTERLLQYIWQFQHLNLQQLCTTDQEPLQIIHAGNYNSNQGPDFLNAKIKIGNTIWAGSIELHVQASEWALHKHSSDKNYDNVILHVVWQNDLNSPLPFPTLELYNRVSNMLLSRYQGLMDTQKFIPCQEHISSVPAITIMACKDRMVAERLQHRTTQVEKYLVQNKWHWEETFWWLLARNFGIKINSDAFEAIARSLPVHTLAKNKNQLHKIEALLFGQAQLLNTNFEEDYPNMLRKEYLFLQKKYSLIQVHQPLHFLRMRPANFPTVRLAQLAVLITQSQHLFSRIKDAETIKEIEALLDVTANDYWHYHYMFDEPSAFKKKNIGKQMMQNIIINTIVPILFTYGSVHKSEAVKAKAITWLESTAAEHNQITKGFTALAVDNKNAFDSQALIQLKNAYCNEKKCLQCAIGNKILKN